MADISESGSIDKIPSLKDVRKCNSINFAIKQLVETNNIIFQMEAEINTIPLFPRVYGPDEPNDARKSLIAFKEERSRNQGEFNLSLPCPIIGYLHHAHLSNTNINLNSNQKKKNVNLTPIVIIVLRSPQ
ncbi:hypothetical protein NPIL_83351 [Nephila pilipes]|uniref:Uncharacterized protein n=1 Tax=Nephila pilipes TaxID=299642 RepID=A0A8X6QYV0_NEPPI|nr:hypothetical protein NPIL_83351 [Nephila pilipes]